MSIVGLLIVVSLALGGLAWWFFVWTVKSGQYEDPEGPKYRMLEDEEPTATSSPTTTPTRAVRAEPVEARTATATPTSTQR